MRKLVPRGLASGSQIIGREEHLGETVGTLDLFEPVLENAVDPVIFEVFENVFEIDAGVSASQAHFKLDEFDTGKCFFGAFEAGKFVTFGVELKEGNIFYAILSAKIIDGFHLHFFGKLKAVVALQKRAEAAHIRWVMENGLTGAFAQSHILKLNRVIVKKLL